MRALIRVMQNALPDLQSLNSFRTLRPLCMFLQQQRETRVTSPLGFGVAFLACFGLFWWLCGSCWLCVVRAHVTAAALAFLTSLLTCHVMCGLTACKLDYQLEL